MDAEDASLLETHTSYIGYNFGTSAPFLGELTSSDAANKIAAASVNKINPKTAV